MQEHFVSGVVLDPRPAAAKALDIQHVEVSSSLLPPVWTEKPESAWRKFPIRNQDGSGTCVAQTAAKLLGIENYLETGTYFDASACDIYTRRKNKPDVGMYGQDALSIVSKPGTTSEARWPSQNMSETQVNAPHTLTAEDAQIEDTYRAGGYVMLPYRDIDTVAAVIQHLGKGAMLFFDFEYDEWGDVPVLKHDSRRLLHSVTGVDITIYDGKKAIIIDDSWGNFYGFNGQRVITEDFFKSRNFFAGYLRDLSNTRRDTDPTPQRPQHRFDNNLYFDSKNDEIKILQDILKYEQLYPQKTNSTGLYWTQTARSVMAFQRKYNVIPESEVIRLQGKVCGPNTRKKLNELYA